MEYNLKGSHEMSMLGVVMQQATLLLDVQYIPRNMHTVFALLCFVVVTHWLIFPYPPGLLHWHCDNLTIAPVPAKQPWWIWINTSCEFIMNDCITTTKQSATKPCAYFLGYTVGLLCLNSNIFALFISHTVNRPLICIDSGADSHRHSSSHLHIQYDALDHSVTFPH